MQMRFGLFEDEDGEAAKMPQDEDDRCEFSHERGGQRHVEARVAPFWSIVVLVDADPTGCKFHATLQRLFEESRLFGVVAMVLGEAEREQVQKADGRKGEAESKLAQIDHLELPDLSIYDSLVEEHEATARCRQKE